MEKIVCLGTFKDLIVPPTLVSFAVTTGNIENIISPEFKKPGSSIVYIPLKRDEEELPDFENLEKNYTTVYEQIKSKNIISANVVKEFGVIEAISKMCFGNKLGIEFEQNINIKELSKPAHGGIIVEIDDISKLKTDYILLGTTTNEQKIKINNEEIDLNELIEIWQKPLSPIFPLSQIENVGVAAHSYPPLQQRPILICKNKIAKPKVFIPVFPGTNCEMDVEESFIKAEAIVDTFIFRNLNKDDIDYSIKEFVTRINNSQIIMFPGGFSSGDEPDGSGKYIAAVLRNPQIAEAITNLLENRDGLILGICNGFQALIKLGLLPYGKICEMTENSPTLTFNTIGRHISRMVNTKIITNNTPWLRKVNVGDVHTIPISHGEGRFYAKEEVLKELIANDQIATRYVNVNDSIYNPNNSVYDVEGIISPDGRVLGKMGHSERIGKGLYKNVVGEMDQKIFESGVEYYK